MPVINGVYLKDFAALPSAVVDANIIPIAISGNQIAYRTTVGGIVTDARVTSKLLTGLSVTGGAVVATDTILQAFGKVQNQINSKVSSVGLTMPAAFSVANSPITSAGTLAVTAIGAASQYIRGDGALADFPTTGGGGSSVAYYLNGSVSQGTIGGNTYYEMNKTPVIGTGTDFTIAADGYIAQFITDANDPASLLIPAGNWNVEMYFSASSSGGTPSFYVEVYKYNGTTFTLLGSSATTPEGITNGTAIDIYYTSVGIPETVLTITDRLAIRVYVDTSGRTITLHTEDNHLSEIVTTFSNGLTALNGLTKQAQYFATGTTGTDFNISSSVDTHTFNIPSASASNRGLITTGSQTIAGTKTFSVDTVVNGVNIGTGGGNIVSNTANGNAALINNTTGSGNTASGYQALFSNTTGSTNTGNGVQALFSNTTGGNNTAYGVQALYNNTIGTSNTASGYNALFSNTTGTSNTANGFNVLFSNTTGGNNTGNGIQALYYNTTGLYNTANGVQAGSANTTGSNNIFLGYNSTGESATESNRTWIGNTDTTSTWVGGNLLLGTRTNATSDKLQVTGSAKITGQLTLGSTITNGTYTYTLPSATGTLALTSDIHSAVTLSAIGSTPNANAATLTGQVLNLEPASASYGGVVTTGTQTFAGQKTFIGNINASPTSGNAIQAYTTSSVAIQVQSTTGDGVQSSSTTGAAIKGSASAALGYGVVGEASGVSGAGGYFSGSSSATYAVFATATGSTTTALYATANSASYPVQRLVQSGAGAIALFDNSGGTVVTISNAGNLTANSFVKTGGTSSQFLMADGSVNTSVSPTGAYLPLTGGTLTGALSGTSATFSGNVLVQKSQPQIQLYQTVADHNYSILGNTSTALEFWHGTFGSNTTKMLSLAAGTGAATFSGAVTISNGASNKLTLSGGSSQNGMTWEAVGGANSFYAFNGTISSAGWGLYNVTTAAFPIFVTNGSNVIIGTTTDAGYKLDVNGTGRFSGALNINTTNGPSNFITLNDGNVAFGAALGLGSSGDFVLSSIASSVVTERFRVARSTGAATFSANINAVTAFEFSNTNNTSGNGNLVSLLGANCNNTSSYHLIAATGGADKFYLYGNGTYTTVSDRRLKKNISTIQDTFLDKVLKLNIVNYQWNDQTDNDALELGMIAQEVEEIIPSIVHEGREDDNGNKYKGIQASVLPYILIKAIQELKAEIDILKNK